MQNSPLDPRTVRMPDFAPGEWLNVPTPLTPHSLRGHAVLVDFWEYTCINCLRTLPYLKTWHERYAQNGLILIGVHSPEFKFSHPRAQIEAALERLGIRYPVLLDNEYQTWLRFANRAWPTKYLIDPDGYIRYKIQGEGNYQATERAIQAVLRQHNPDLDLPDVLPPLRPEDAPGAMCYRPTPELHTGHVNGSLGNPEDEPSYLAERSPLVYALPPAEDRQERSFYVSGIWRAEAECLVFAGQDGGEMALPFSAAGVNAVISPSADPVELLLDLSPEEDRRKRARGDVLPIVEVRLDGRTLTPANAGEDILYNDGGVSYMLVDSPRLYALADLKEFRSGELTLTFRANGLAVYAFTFTSCVVNGSDE
jgi:thiol-disulfide isomerase/thioredoxin